jgi:hypothetical protein
MLRVQGIDGNDRPGQAGERSAHFPHRGNRVRFRVHGDLPENRADAVGE